MQNPTPLAYPIGINPRASAADSNPVATAPGSDFNFFASDLLC
jgi:hypothetical protein